MLLLNGRLSTRSYARWRRWPGLIGPCSVHSGCAWRRTRCRPSVCARSAPRVWTASAISNRPAQTCRATDRELARLRRDRAGGRSGSPPAPMPAKRKSPRGCIAVSPAGIRSADDHRAAPSGARRRDRGNAERARPASRPAGAGRADHARNADSISPTRSASSGCSTASPASPSSAARWSPRAGTTRSRRPGSTAPSCTART